MSRDNLCLALEDRCEKEFPKACQLFRKIIDNYEDLEPEECMRLFDIFNEFQMSNSQFCCGEARFEDCCYPTEKAYTYLP